MTVDCRAKSEQSVSAIGLYSISAPTAEAKFEKENDDGDLVVQCLCYEYPLRHLRLVGTYTPCTWLWFWA